MRRSIYWKVVVPFTLLILADVAASGLFLARSAGQLGLLESIVVAASAAASVIFVGALLAIRTITGPLKRITAAAEKVSSGELDQRIETGSSDEIGQLGHAFNEMTVNLRRMMSAVADEKTKLATVLSAMTDGVIMADSERRVLLANPAAERLLDFGESEALGLPLIEVVRDHEIDEVLKKCLKSLNEETSQLDSFSGRFLRVVAVPLTGARPPGALLMIQDLTEMRSVQTMRREFVGNISHELRTPLAGIQAIVETLQNGAIEDKKVAGDFLNQIAAEVDGMTQMVAELIDLSRIETGRVSLKLEPVSLNSLVVEVIGRLNTQAERQQVALFADLGPDVPDVQADRERIRQVLVNLVHNAIKFSHLGGKVTVSTRVENGRVVGRVTDTGIGIAREDLPHIFERFFKADKSRSTTGTGLGLAIVKHTVEAHGGTVSVQSQGRAGSVFSFTLPLEPPTPPSRRI